MQGRFQPVSSPMPPARLAQGTESVKEAARNVSLLCRERGSDIAKCALQFSIANPAITTTIAGSAIREHSKVGAMGSRTHRCSTLKVLHLFQPVKNIGHVEGLAINN